MDQAQIIAIIEDKFNEYTFQLIRKIEEIPRTLMLGGEESPYTNAWEEYVAHVQIEKSQLREQYERLIQYNIWHFVKELPETEVRLLWLGLPSEKESERNEPHIDAIRSDVTDMLAHLIREEAAHYPLSGNDIGYDKNIDLETSTICDLFLLYPHEKELLMKLELSIREMMPRCGPSEFACMTKLIHFLRELPYSTSEVEFSLSLKLYTGSLMEHVSLYVSDENLQFQQGGFLDRSAGGDSFGEIMLDLNLGGTREGSVRNFSEWVDSFAHMAANRDIVVVAEDMRPEIIPELSTDHEHDGWERINDYLQARQSKQ